MARPLVRYAPVSSEKGCRELCADLEHLDPASPHGVATFGSRWGRLCHATRGFMTLGALSLIVVALRTFAHPRQLTTLHANVDRKIALRDHATVYVSWKRHPDKCWSIPDGQMSDAVKLQIWDCPDDVTAESVDRFIFPAGGSGPIRSASFPDFCLNVPGHSSVLQFWHCGDPKVPPEHFQWTVPTSSTGFIRPKHAAHRCIDVPADNTTNGHVLQQWDCMDNTPGNELFVVHLVPPCHWDAWSDWGLCLHGRRVHERHAVSNVSAECVGMQRDGQACGRSGTTRRSVGPGLLAVLGLAASRRATGEPV